MTRRLLSLCLCLTLMVQQIPVVHATLNFWQLDIIDIQEHTNLVTEETITLYTGDTQLVTHTNQPAAAEDRYVLVELSAEKTVTDTAIFQITSAQLEVGGQTFPLAESRFLEDHNRTPFPLYELRFGAHQGFLVFEVPQSIPLEGATLTVAEQTIPLAISERLSQPTTDIPIRENLVDAQYQTETQLLADYAQGSYTPEDPYLIVDPYQWAPLTALILFETETPATVSLQVEGKDDYTWVEHTFSTPRTSHQIPVIGLYPEYDNGVHLTLTYADGTTQTTTHTVTTEPLVEDNMQVEVDLITSQPEKMEAGFTFLVNNLKRPLVVDSNGEVRWVLDHPVAQTFKRIDNGNILMMVEELTGFFEMDLLGKIYNQYSDPWKIHHDVIELPSGNFLTTSEYDYYIEDRIVELDRESGLVVNDLDFKELLDQNRFNQDYDEIDWLHMNSIWYDQRDNTIIVSARHQGVMKLTYPQGELVWITSLPQELEGLEEAFLTPIEEDFKFPSGQHSPMIMPDQDGNPDTIDLMLYDNNHIALQMEDYDGNMEYSQMVQYRIDEKNKTIEQIWDYGKELGFSYFTEMVGDADYFEDGTVLGTFGYRTEVVQQSGNLRNIGTVIEVDYQTKEVVYQLDVLFNDKTNLYRAERLPLYPETWDFQLPAEKADIKVRNTQDKIQEVESLTQQSKFSSGDGLHGDLSPLFQDTYQTLDIQGWQVIKGVDPQEYQTSLVFQSEDFTFTTPVDLHLNVNAKEIVTQAYQDGVDYGNCGFYATIPYALLYSTLPKGVYNLGILVETETVTQYHQFAFYFTVDQQYVALPNVDILENQTQISQDLALQFSQGAYTQDDPFIQMDPYQTSPLTALVGFTTRDASTVTVTIPGDIPETTFTHTFDTPGTEHLLPIYGLYPDRVNPVEITVSSALEGTKTTVVELKTAPLPEDMQLVEVLASAPETMAGQLTIASSVYLTGYDGEGKVRWYLTSNMILDNSTPITLLENGHMALQLTRLVRPALYAVGIHEVDYLGKIYYEYTANGIHHEIQVLENGNFVLASEDTPDYIEDFLIEINRTTGAVVREWDLKEVLDIERLSDPAYLESRIEVVQIAQPDLPPETVEAATTAALTSDWFHNNSITIDEENNYMVVSGRQKDCIMAFDMDTLEILWMITDPTASWTEPFADKLLTPVNQDFQYSYGIHSCQLLENGDLLVFDNGNFRSKDYATSLSAEENYSRGVHYRIDPEAMTVEEVFQFGEELGSAYYSPYISSIDGLGEEHYLINFGGIVKDENGTPLNTPNELFFHPETSYGETQIIEVVEGEISSQLRLHGVFNAGTYRAVRQSPYDNTSQYVDLTHLPQRLGTAKPTTGWVEMDLPVPGNQAEVVFSTAVDEGDRIAIAVDFHRELHQEEAYLVLEGDTETLVLPITPSTTYYINKEGLEDKRYLLGTLLVDPEGKKDYTQSTLYFDAEEVLELSIPTPAPLGVLGSVDMVLNDDPTYIWVFLTAAIAIFSYILWRKKT